MDNTNNQTEKFSQNSNLPEQSSTSWPNNEAENKNQIEGTDFQPAAAVNSEVPDWEKPSSWSSDAPDLNPNVVSSANTFKPETDFDNGVEKSELNFVAVPMESQANFSPDPRANIQEKAASDFEQITKNNSDSAESPNAIETLGQEISAETPKETPEDQIDTSDYSEKITNVEEALEEAVSAKEQVEEVKKKAQAEIDAANENARNKAEQVLKIIDEAVKEAEGVIQKKKAELDLFVKERQAEIDTIHEKVTKLKRKKTEMRNFLGIASKES